MYQFIDDNAIRRFNGDGTDTWIPAQKENPDYQAYLAWLDQGNTPEPAPVPEPPPQLTAAERLEAAGFDVDELRALLFGRPE